MAGCFFYNNSLLVSLDAAETILLFFISAVFLQGT